LKVATDEAVSLYFAISSLFTIIEAQHASNNIAFEHLGIYISDALSLLRYSSNEQVIDLTIEDSSDEVVRELLQSVNNFLHFRIYNTSM